MSNVGSWIVERSDGFVFEFRVPDVPILFGRDKTLPSRQRIDSKYISRQHFSMEWRPPSLFARQLGRNPTFYSMEFHQLPGDSASGKELEFRSCHNDEEKKVGDCASRKGVVFVSCEVKGKSQPSHEGNGKNMGWSTLHFPGELNLPQFTVRYVVPDMEKKVEEATSYGIPSVPLFCFDVDDKEEDETERRLKTTGSWRGILETVLHEHQQKEC